VRIAFAGEFNAAPPIATLEFVRRQFPGAVWYVTDAFDLDLTVRAYAQAHSIEAEVIRADPDPAYRHSGIARDKWLVDAADLLVAYSRNRTTGRVFGAVNAACTQGKPILVFPVR
jgi:hypothetical protein